MRRAAWTAWLTVALLSAPTAGDGQARRERPLEPGDHMVRLEAGGRARWALVRVPQASRQGPLPLLVAFHGGGGEPEGYQEYAGFDVLAEREGFVVAYPAGSGPLPRRLLTWNAGTHCCGRAREEGVDDVAFTRRLVEHLAGRVALDRRRIYVVGHSNGAMMAYRVAAEAADMVAAVVGVAGAMQVPSFEPSRPVPVLHVHSEDDPRAPYGGGTGPPFPLGGSTVDHRPVEEGLVLWARRNGCRGEPAEVPGGRRRGVANPEHEAVRIRWGVCPPGAPVELLRLRGPGHGWPGADLPDAREELAGPATDVISAAEEAWRFVARHRRLQGEG